MLPKLTFPPAPPRKLMCPCLVPALIFKTLKCLESHVPESLPIPKEVLWVAYSEAQSLTVKIPPEGDLPVTTSIAKIPQSPGFCRLVYLWFGIVLFGLACGAGFSEVPLLMCTLLLLCIL